MCGMEKIIACQISYVPLIHDHIDEKVEKYFLFQVYTEKRTHKIIASLPPAKSSESNRRKKPQLPIEIFNTNQRKNEAQYKNMRTPYSFLLKQINLSLFLLRTLTSRR